MATRDSVSVQGILWWPRIFSDAQGTCVVLCTVTAQGSGHPQVYCSSFRGTPGILWSPRDCMASPETRSPLLMFVERICKFIVDKSLAWGETVPGGAFTKLTQDRSPRRCGWKLPPSGVWGAKESGLLRVYFLWERRKLVTSGWSGGALS